MLTKKTIPEALKARALKARINAEKMLDILEGSHYICELSGEHTAYVRAPIVKGNRIEGFYVEEGGEEIQFTYTLREGFCDCMLPLQILQQLEIVASYISESEALDRRAHALEMVL